MSVFKNEYNFFKDNKMKIKSLLSAICALALCGSASATGVAQFDLSSLSNLNLGSIVNSLVSTDDVDVDDLTGTWSVTGPAVVFKSESLLQKAGGTAAQSVIESKLDSTFDKIGIEGTKFTFDGSENFTMTLNSGRTISGTVTKGSTDGTLVFNFSQLGSSKLGSVTAYVSKGTQLSLTFDVSKLNSIVSAVAKVSGNSTATSISSLLSSYKGIYAGFKLEK